MKRHAKKDPNVRCCWICGNVGGMGASYILKLLGYEIELRAGPNYEIGYAHIGCITKARAQQREAHG